MSQKTIEREETDFEELKHKYIEGELTDEEYEEMVGELIDRGHTFEKEESEGRLVETGMALDAVIERVVGAISFHALPIALIVGALGAIILTDMTLGIVYALATFLVPFLLLLLALWYTYRLI